MIYFKLVVQNEYIQDILDNKIYLCEVEPCFKLSAYIVQQSCNLYTVTKIT